MVELIDTYDLNRMIRKKHSDNFVFKNTGMNNTVYSFKSKFYICYVNGIIHLALDLNNETIYIDIKNIEQIVYVLEKANLI